MAAGGLGREMASPGGLRRCAAKPTLESEEELAGRWRQLWVRQ